MIGELFIKQYFLGPCCRPCRRACLTGYYYDSSNEESQVAFLTGISGLGKQILHIAHAQRQGALPADNPRAGSLNIIGIIKGKRIIGADVVELAPTLDPTGNSEVFAAKVVRELILACHSEDGYAR